MFKARNRLFPDNLQRLFRLRSRFRLRNIGLKSPYACFILKQMCLIYGMKLWNSLEIEFKYLQNNINFKMTVKDCSDLMAKCYEEL